jgi:hypothetical protein
VFLGQFRDGLYVFLDHSHCLTAIVGGDIISASQKNHCCRVEVNHVGKGTDEHLRRGLPMYAAVYVGLTRKKLGSLPALGN